MAQYCVLAAEGRQRDTINNNKINKKHLKIYRNKINGLQDKL
jgi:hypothetical protein